MKKKYLKSGHVITDKEHIKNIKAIKDCVYNILMYVCFINTHGRVLLPLYNYIDKLTKTDAKYLQRPVQSINNKLREYNDDVEKLQNSISISFNVGEIWNVLNKYYEKDKDSRI